MSSKREITDFKMSFCCTILVSGSRREKGSDRRRNSSKGLGQVTRCRTAPGNALSQNAPPQSFHKVWNIFVCEIFSRDDSLCCSQAQLTSNVLQGTKVRWMLAGGRSSNSSSYPVQRKARAILNSAAIFSKWTGKPKR